MYTICSWFAICSFWRGGIIVLDKPNSTGIPLNQIKEIGATADSILSAKVMHSEAAAIAWVEARVWPKGPVCPHCGGVDRIAKMGGKATRIGPYKCYQCRKQFTVKVGTVFEDSHVPMHLWLQAMYLLARQRRASAPISFHRTLGVTLKTAWFMSHRLREAMRVSASRPWAAAATLLKLTKPTSADEGAPKDGTSPCGTRNTS